MYSEVAVEVVVEYPWGGQIDYPVPTLKILTMLAKIMDIGVTRKTREFEVYLNDLVLRVVGLQGDDNDLPDWIAFDPVWVILDRKTDTELARYRNSNGIRSCLTILKPYVKVLEICRTYSLYQSSRRVCLYSLNNSLETSVSHLETLVSKLDVAEKRGNKIGNLRQRIGNRKRKITSIKGQLEEVGEALKNSVSSSDLCDKAFAKLCASTTEKWGEIATNLGAHFAKKSDIF